MTTGSTDVVTSTHSDIFGRLLRSAITSIAAYEAKTPSAVEGELGAQFGVAETDIQHYKAGYVPAEPRVVALFAEVGVRRGFLARTWLGRFLEAARYPTPDALRSQLADALGAPAPLAYDGLPSGTVALLFTDIAGSTTRWEQQPGPMEHALERHDTILRRAVDAYGGQVFKTVGDAFYAVFTTVPAALESALAAQRALLSEEWGPVGSLLVRMAIHAGAPQLRDGDYFGPSMNRVARVISAGHGGQVLLSHSAQNLARDSLPPDAQLRDLGEHRLKDLGRPEHIFQLEAPDLPADFPPLRTLDSYRHNLPPQATPLIGREAEVAQVVGLLARDGMRLITLTGPGGIGKTRLALQVAADALDSYRDGVLFVALAPLKDPDQVLAAIVQALGAREQPGVSPVEQLYALLKPRRMLLVLDNFEQVVAAGPAVGALLAATPGVKALVTSRETLKLYGEQEYPVPSMGLPQPGQILPVERLAQIEAVRLFIERAQAVRPDFAVTAETAPLIAEICIRLDGLPLAIELAAARSKLFPPKALLARLGQGLRLLRDGPRDLPARQQTLANAIAWSYDLLDAMEQTIFVRLAVFVGGCVLAAAEAILGDDNETSSELSAYVPRTAVLDGLSALVDRSLLRQLEGAAGDPRFIMLETIREYALERLDASGEGTLLRSRHAAYYRVLAEEAEPELRRAEQVVWLSRLEHDRDNIRTAVIWSADHTPTTAAQIAGALWWFWYYSGRYRDGLSWCVSALERTAILGAIRPRIQCAVGGAMLALYHAELDQARQLCEVAIEMEPLVGAQEQLTLAYNILGTVERTQGNYSAARQHYEASLALARSAGERWLTALALGNLGIMAFHQGDILSANTLLTESLALFRTLGDTWYMATLLHILGRTTRQAGNNAQAEAYLRESLALFRTLGNQWGIALSIGGIAAVKSAQGDYEGAAELLGAEEALRKAVGEPLYPSIRIDHEQTVAELHQSLGEAATRTAWARGQALTLEQIQARVLATKV